MMMKVMDIVVMIVSCYVHNHLLLCCCHPSFLRYYYHYNRQYSMEVAYVVMLRDHLHGVRPILMRRLVCYYYHHVAQLLASQILFHDENRFRRRQRQLQNDYRHAEGTMIRYYSLPMMWMPLYYHTSTNICFCFATSHPEPRTLSLVPPAMLSLPLTWRFRFAVCHRLRGSHRDTLLTK